MKNAISIANSVIIRGAKYRNAPAMLATSEGVTPERLVPMLDHSIPNSTTESIPYGYCHCGCGEKTSISTHTVRKKGYVKGQPRKFIRFHHLRRRREPIWNELDGCFDVPLGNGLVAKVSAEDRDKVAGHAWSMSPDGYAMSGGNWPERGRMVMRMHRLIMDAPDGVLVDHINHDKLDNRRPNLRLANQSENGRNRFGAQRGSSSRYLGVSFSTESKKWIAQLQVDGKRVLFKKYDSEFAAARARDRAAIEAHGKFAKLNFPVVLEEEN